MERNQENIERDQPAQSHNHEQKPLKAWLMCWNIVPMKEYPLFSFFGRVFLIAFRNCLIDGMAPLRILKDNNPIDFCIPRTEAIIFSEDETTLAVFGADKERQFHYFDCLWLTEMKSINTLGWETFRKTSWFYLKRCQISPWCPFCQDVTPTE